MGNMVGRSKRKSRKLLLFTGVLCICFLLGTGFIWSRLRNGVELQRFDLASVHAEGIFLQLKEGIIFTVERLDLGTKVSSGTLPQPERLLERSLGWIHLVREIRINNLSLQGQNYSLQYQNNVFSLSGENFQLSSAVTYEQGKVLLDIARLEIKPYSVTLSGKAEYVRKSQSLLFEGAISIFGIDGRLDFRQRRDNIDAEIQSERFTDLPALLAHMPLDPEALSWVRENITADDYVIDHLHLGFTLKEGKPEIRPNSFYGTATATGGAIRFEQSLPPVLCKRIHVSYENDKLAFALEEPLYKGRNIEGSSVTIAPLLGKEVTRLAISIRTDSRLDSDIHELLKAYDIELPLTQQSGTTRGDLQLVFDLPDFTLHTKGTFQTGEGEWTFGDTPFLADSANVQLHDDKVIIDRADIRYRDMLQASVQGNVDTSAGQADLTADIQRFAIHERESDIVTVRDLSMPIIIRFSQDRTDIRMPLLQTDINISPSRRLVSLNDLNKIWPYIVFLNEFHPPEGRMAIDVTDPQHLAFTGSIETDALPLVAGNEPVKHFSLHGTKTPERLTAIVNEGKITITAAEKLIIRLHDYLLQVDADTIGRKAGSVSPVPIVISGPASRITLKQIVVPTNTFQTKIQGENVSFSAELPQGNLLFESDGSDITLAATDIDAQLAQDFFPFADLRGGRFNLSLKGKDEQNYEGYVEFSNVLIKDAALLNNVLSFVNAIPALATFSSPGFDSDGYQVNQGVANFSRSGDLVTIQQLRTDGTTINTEAKGWVDLENDILKINVKLIGLKDYSKIISKIPWAGYAILGQDGSLSTSLLVAGDLDEPTITTSLSKEIIMIPINIVKRTIQWPARLFSKLKDLAAETPDNGDESDFIPDEGSINDLYKISPP